jgi:hypothetical protein
MYNESKVLKYCVECLRYHGTYGDEGDEEDATQAS